MPRTREGSAARNLMVGRGGASAFVLATKARNALPCPVNLTTRDLPAPGEDWKASSAMPCPSFDATLAPLSPRPSNLDFLPIMAAGYRICAKPSKIMLPNGCTRTPYGITLCAPPRSASAARQGSQDRHLALLSILGCGKSLGIGGIGSQPVQLGQHAISGRTLQAGHKNHSCASDA